MAASDIAREVDADPVGLPVSDAVLPTNSGWRDDPALYSALIFVALCLAVIHQLMFRTLAEDAFITFRYSDHLAHGLGAVFNRGEAVEGYSNFSWMVLLAGTERLGLGIIGPARVLGVVCVLIAVVLTAQLSLRVGSSRLGGALAALLVAASGSVAAYGPSGLETSFYVALLLATVLLAAQRRYVLAGTVCALAVFTRPDGALLAAVVAIWIVATQDDRWRRVVRFAAPVALLVGVWTIWRVLYYGHLVPNAIAAKSGLPLERQLSEGVEYVETFARSTWPFLILLLYAAVALVVRRSLLQRDHVHNLLLVTAVLVVQVGQVAAVGGDWMPAWRFLAPSVPLAAVLIATGLSVSVLRTEAVGLGIAAVGLCVAFGFHASMNDKNLEPRVRTWEIEVRALTQVGKWIGANLQGESIATYANGSLSYYAGRDIEVIDILGLTDEHIARHGLRLPDAPVGHAAVDHEYVARRRPTLVILFGGGYAPAPSCEIQFPFVGAYEPVIFENVNGWANILVLRSERDRVVSALADANHVPIDCPLPPAAPASVPTE